jgi:hypothetical protein
MDRPFPTFRNRRSPARHRSASFQTLYYKLYSIYTQAIRPSDPCRPGEGRTAFFIVLYKTFC